MTGPVEILVAFSVSLAVLGALYPFAPALGLIDHPGERRKVHRHPVPPIGGIAIFSGILASSLLTLPGHPSLLFGLLGAGLLVCVGALDDRFGLGPRVRLAAQTGAVLLLTLGGGVTLTSLGDLLGLGPIDLGPLAVPFTVFAMVGIINAFNMIDGIDGLAGGLMLIGVGPLLVLAPDIGPLQVMLLAAIAALIPYLICNLELLGCTGRKVFLGDAGSMLLGYLLVWALVDAAGPRRAIDPVTALWLTAVPLMDALGVMGRRMLQGTSPFTADRAHLHHLLSRISGSTRVSLLLMLSGAAALAAVGVAGRVYEAPTPVLFYAGILVFVAYLVFLRLVQRLHRSVRRRRRQLAVEAL